MPNFGRWTGFGPRRDPTLPVLRLRTGSGPRCEARVPRTLGSWPGRQVLLCCTCLERATPVRTARALDEEPAGAT